MNENHEIKQNLDKILKSTDVSCREVNNSKEKYIK